jgi:arylsulfatase A-like enzyme
MLGACSGEGSASQTMGSTTEPMNIVLISIDSIRRDHLGPYGHKPQYAPDIPVTPALDSLAADGVVFEDAWTTSSWTLPAHMSLMTGLSDRRHGVENDRFQLDPLRQTMAETLQDAGWNTAGYFSGPYLDAKFGFDRGFDDYRSGMITPEDFLLYVQDQQKQREALGKPPLDESTIHRMRDSMSHWDITSPRINQLGLEFLDQQEKKDNFFLFLHYFDAHYDHIPWRMEEGLGKRFDPGYDKTGKQNFDGSGWYFDTRVMGGKPPYERRISPRDLDHVKAFYDAEIHWVDRHIGEIIARLKEKGMWENTIIMVVADHGDEFFDHNSIGHRSTLFAEQCRIPMILRVPGVTPSGRRVAEISRIYDSAPTLLDFAGAPALQEAEGASLRATIDGNEEPRFALQRIYSGGHRRAMGKLNVRDGWRNSRYSVVRQFRYDQANSTEETLAVLPMTTRSTGSAYLVFDRQQDPLEMRPLAASDPRYVEAINAFCRDFRASEKGAAELKVSPLLDRLGPIRSAEEQAVLDGLGYTSDTEDEEGGGLTQALAPLPEPCLQ